MRSGCPPSKIERLRSTAAIRSPVVSARVSRGIMSIEVSGPVGAFPTTRPHRVLSPSPKRTIMTPIWLPFLRSANLVDLLQPSPRRRAERILDAHHSTHINLALTTEREHRPKQAKGELRTKSVRQVVAPGP